jgi:hypothetical protein
MESPQNSANSGREVAGMWLPVVMLNSSMFEFGLCKKNRGKKRKPADIQI